MSAGKGMNDAPKTFYIRSLHAEDGMAYGTRVLWSQSRRSTQRMGKLFTRGRATGGISISMSMRQSK